MSTPQAPVPPPVTGVGPIDEALAGLRLGEDVTGHPAEFTAVLEVLQRALNSPAEQQ